MYITMDATRVRTGRRLLIMLDSIANGSDYRIKVYPRDRETIQAGGEADQRFGIGKVG